MAGAAHGAKRTRAAAFSAHERYMHKSGVVLQREGKKIRAFLVRKAVAQLKQTREQHVAAEQAVAALGAGEELDKKRKRAQGKATKLFYQLDKLDRELKALKTLDLKAIVARAFDKTRLKTDEEVDSDSESEQDDGGDARQLKAGGKMNAHAREMFKYGRGRVEAEEVETPRPQAEKEEEEEEMEIEEEDDGFHSEDYDEVPRDVAVSESSDEDMEDAVEEEEEEEAAESESEEEEQSEHGDSKKELESEALEEEEETAGEDAVFYGPQGPPGVALEVEVEESAPSGAEAALVEQLIDRVLAHNQMQPFLDAIKQYVEKREREQAKKLRQKEKKAIKRARATMIGGRSSAAPTSMFFGSLSGSLPDDDEPGASAGGYGRASMAGAEDDIAEFLGETKKKKNRAGQNARRQKAIRMEEERRLAETGGGGSGGFQKRGLPLAGKYGPSERPKKQPKKDVGGRKKDGDRAPRAPSTSWQDKDTKRSDRGDRGFKARGGEDSRPERRAPREQTALPPPRPRAPAPLQRKPEEAPSHPSWLAKQAQKEKMKVDINAFAGKKITFGDD